MYYRDEVIRYLQACHILALKLDHALSGVADAVSNQIDTLGAGAKRALYYTSCFTDAYQEVCQQQKIEDIRFKNGVIHLLQHDSVVFDMLRLYFAEILRYKTSDQLEQIKRKLMTVNIHIAASSLTSAGFTLAIASAIAIGLNLNLQMTALLGQRTAGILTGISVYGVIQKAADSAHRLHSLYPAYYTALYAQQLEMMYFLVEPLFERANAFRPPLSNDRIADIITRMIR
ncbi:hypothetical protein [Pantoea sp. C2G6]|uniref:hypothetical protein n=1 Tax=Pantoea sp. C2G6 TaxID=3243084 RepID=UPI003ED9E73F